MDEKEPLLVIEAVSKTFERVKAVDEVSLTVRRGEIYALIGPNGAGKTTLIKMMVGMWLPDDGTIRVGGHEMEAEPVAAKRLIGYIPDEPFVYDYISGYELLELTGDLFGLKRTVITTRVEPLAKQFGMETILHERAADYSRGNKQKLSIIAALLHKPKLLVIDEPIVGLDAASQHTTEQLLQEFAKNGGAVLVCTHTLSVVETIADKVGILQNGKLIEEGSLRQLTSGKTSLEKRFLAITKTG